MQRPVIIVSLLLALGAAVWLGILAGDSATPPPPLPVDGSLSAVRSTEEGAIGISGGSSTPVPGDVLIPGEPTAAALAPPPGIQKSATAPTGPEVIEQWMTSTDIPGIVKTSLLGFPKLDPKDHLLAVSKIAPLVPDAEFDIALKRLLVDPKTSEDAKDYLYRDVVNRAPEAKWPALFAVMNSPGHAHAQDARESLASDLGADFGLNQGQWLAKIQQALRERNGIGQ